MSESHIGTLDIEIYDDEIVDNWRQGKFLVRGYEDVMWTDDIEEALGFFRESIEMLIKNSKEKN